jgi:hypothetical protein
MGVALRTGEPQRDNEVVIERPDGSRIIVLVNVELLRSPGGELEWAIASFQDITGRKRIEEALASRVDEQAALYQFSNQLQRATSFADIHEAALDAIIRALRCQRASILLGDEAGKMRFVAWHGLSADYRGPSPDIPRGRTTRTIHSLLRSRMSRAPALTRPSRRSRRRKESPRSPSFRWSPTPSSSASLWRTTRSPYFHRRGTQSRYYHRPPTRGQY